MQGEPNARRKKKQKYLPQQETNIPRLAFNQYKVSGESGAQTGVEIYCEFFIDFEQNYCPILHQIK